MAEIRDLNRHRTGQKYCPLVPLGFYHAADQVPKNTVFDPALATVGYYLTTIASKHLTDERSGFPGWFLLGTQFEFEHTTTLDKFIYEAELRTGTGAHYRYASHLHSIVDILRVNYSTLINAILLGQNEPE